MLVKNKILVVGLLLILTACGQKGPLILNETKSQKTAVQLKPKAEPIQDQPQKIEEQYQ
jgi:predicted small lipoprotein YifL